MTEIDLLKVLLRIGEIAKQLGPGEITRDRLEPGARMPDGADGKREANWGVHAAQGSIRIGISRSNRMHLVSVTKFTPNCR